MLNLKGKTNHIILFLILTTITLILITQINKASVDYKGSVERDHFVLDSLRAEQDKIRKERKPSKPKFKNKFRTRRVLP